MTFMHLSDLHIGKRVNEYSMLEDQAYILKTIVRMVKETNPDAIIMAGDIYDKSAPSAEAVALFDEFLVSLAQTQIPVFIISGNHDSPERLSFGGRLMTSQGVYVSPVYDGHVTPVTLHDDYGDVNFYLLPFVKPAHVRRYMPEDADIPEPLTYTQAMAWAVEQMNIDKTQRNVLVTHQFVVGATTSDSEELSVGGTDGVDASVFADFDYVALGHIHGPQNCGAPHIRYCGTPLKYSFSEAKHEKSVTMVEIGEKGNVSITTIPLTPLRDMVEIKGTYNEVTALSFYQHTTYAEDYVHITLTDEEDIPDAVGKLRSIYHHLMKLDYDNQRTRQTQHITVDENARQKSPLQLFADLYQLQNNTPLSEEQTAFMADLIANIWEGEDA